MGDGHQHATTAGQSAGRLRAVLVLLLLLVLAEVGGGLWAGSLALLADAGHLLADAAGLALALLAVSFAARPPTPERTFGFQRAEILAAVVNAVLLFGVGTTVAVLAVPRLVDPGRSDPGVMTAFGLVALAGNAVALLLLHRGAQGSLNVRGAYLEVLSDALGAVGVLAAAGVIALTGEQRADPIASLLVAVLIVPRTVRLLREAVDVLLEATPRGVDLAEVRAHIEQVPGVLSCHDLHAWTITSGTAVLSAHVVVTDEVWAAGEAPRVLDRLGHCVGAHFGLWHATFQLEEDDHAAHEHAVHE